MSGLLLTIRYFQAEDLGELHEIDRICFPEGIAFSRAELLFHMIQPQSIARVAQGSDRILGFVIAFTFASVSEQGRCSAIEKLAQSGTMI